MADFRFLHAADLHLDTPFEGVARGAPAIAQSLRDASLVAFDRLVDRAIAEGVAFVLFAGDVYDGPERGLRAQLRFRRGLERLSEAGIASFIVHGNHDPLEQGWSAVRSWPPGVHVFGAAEVERRPVIRDGERIAVVHGRSFGKRAERTNLARTFRRTEEAAFHVGLLHANVGALPGHDDYAPCSLEDLRAARLDYWALGHVHTRQTLLTGETWAVYPGNLQGRSFKPSELGSKGASLVHVRGNRVERVDHVPLAPVRFEEITVDVSGCSDLAAVERALVAEVEALEGSGVEGWVIAAELRGETELHPELASRAEDLRTSLEDATAGSTPWVHWARLTVRSSLPVDREALRERQDLLGCVLRRLDALRRDPVAREAFLARVDRRLASLTGWKEISAADDLALLDDVENDAIDKLL